MVVLQEPLVSVLPKSSFRVANHKPVSETTHDGIIDLSADVVTQVPGGIRPEVDEDVDMVAVQSSPVEPSSPLFLGWIHSV